MASASRSRKATIWPNRSAGLSSQKAAPRPATPASWRSRSSGSSAVGVRHGSGLRPPASATTQTPVKSSTRRHGGRAATDRARRSSTRGFHSGQRSLAIQCSRHDFSGVNNVTDASGRVSRPACRAERKKGPSGASGQVVGAVGEPGVRLALQNSQQARSRDEPPHAEQVAT